MDSAYKQNNVNNTNHLDNFHSVSLLILVIIVVSSAQHLFSKVPSFANSDYPTGLMAVLAGTIVSLIAFLPIKYLYSGPTGMNHNQVISLSVLLGIIVSYFMVFEIRPGLPSISALALMVFMFYHHIDMMPDSHAKVV